MFEDFFKNVLTFIGGNIGNGDAQVMYNDGDDMKFTLNGKELDLSTEENVKKAYDLVDAFANNPILKMYMTENAINKMVNSAKERIDTIHQSAIDKAHEDTNKFEDDAHYVAKAYLEDTVDGRENVSINALASFFNWMKAQADNE